MKSITLECILLIKYMTIRTTFPSIFLYLDLGKEIPGTQEYDGFFLFVTQFCLRVLGYKKWWMIHSFYKKIDSVIKIIMSIINLNLNVSMKLFLYHDNRNEEKMVTSKFSLIK